MSDHRTTGGWSGNLPPETRNFVGRQGELTWLAEELRPESDSARLVSLVGVGGVGKTRLALRAVGRLQAAYSDGVWLAELSSLHATGRVALAVIEALRLADSTTDPPAEVLCAWAGNKRMLLVLDSCEHMLPDCVELAGDLLAAAPGLRILATSRERLGLPGERVLRVDPLPVSGDAVALFADRAVAADPGFVLGEAEQRTATAVCERLDGIPLAIELAAARLSELSLEQLNSRLGERLPSRLDLLTSYEYGYEYEGEYGGGEPWDDGSAPARPPHHQTLRTTIGWSHELCEPLERLLWARLSVFAGGFGADAAEDVCAGGPLPAERVAALLARLVEQSIVLRRDTDTWDTSNASNARETTRFGMLDTVREYGADWLRELGEEEVVRLWHREYYRRLARDIRADWNTGRQVMWCARIRTENANLRTAVDWSLGRSDRSAQLETVSAVSLLWYLSGNLRDPVPRLDRLLATGPAGPAPGPDLVAGTYVRAMAAVLQSDPDAVGWIRRCERAGREQDARMVEIAVTNLTGVHLAMTDRPAEAIDVASAAAWPPDRDDWLGAVLFQSRLTLSFAHMARGEHEVARKVAYGIREESLSRGEHMTGPSADSYLAQADLARGDIDSAVRNARSAVERHARMNYTISLAMDFEVLADAVVAAGDGHRAARLLGIGRRLWDLTGRPPIDSPHFSATRRSRERRIRDAIGDRAYEEAYEAGRAMSYDDGLAYVTSG